MTSDRKNQEKSPGKQNELKLSKVVYFDEGSATDLIQIFHGGGLNETVELFDSVGEDGKAAVGGNGKAGLGKVLQGIMGFGVSVEGEASVSASYGSNQVARSILSNTVLTDFLACVAEGNSGVKCLEGLEISTIDNTMSSMMLITPYLTMLRSGQGVRAGDFNVSFERIDDAVRKAKGYYELLAKKGGENPIILRFNHSALKNNYKLPDLLKMELVFYAVHVGAASPDSLDITEEVNFSSSDNRKNPSYPVALQGKVETCGSAEGQGEGPYEMYDVILAGVKGNA